MISWRHEQPSWANNELKSWASLDWISRPAKKLSRNWHEEKIIGLFSMDLARIHLCYCLSIIRVVKQETRTRPRLGMGQFSQRHEVSEPKMKFFDHFSWELFKERFVGIWILFFSQEKKSLLSNFRSSQLKIIAWQFCFSLKSCRAQAGTPANSGSRKQFSKKSAPQPKQNHAYCPENENMGAFFTTPWDWLCRGNQVLPRWRTFCLWKFFILGCSILRRRKTKGCVRRDKNFAL